MEVRMLCRTSNSEIVQILLARKHGACERTCVRPKGAYVQACEKFFRPPNKTAQEKVVTSRSECEHEKSRIYCGQRRVSVHDEKELTGEKDTIRRWKETTGITTANGKAGSTEEATVYVNDLDVFVTMMLLEDSPAVLSPGSLC